MEPILETIANLPGEHAKVVQLCVDNAKDMECADIFAQRIAPAFRKCAVVSHRINKGDDFRPSNPCLHMACCGYLPDVIYVNSTVETEDLREIDFLIFIGNRATYTNIVNSIPISNPIPSFYAHTLSSVMK